MSVLETPLYCASATCRAPNALDASACHQCETPLVRLYLRAIGPGAEKLEPGELLGDRYRVTAGAVVLDTRPSERPDLPEMIPDDLLPYPRLSPYRLHVPQVYGRVGDLWLLEYGSARSRDLESELASGKVLPVLGEVWAEAAPLRQLHWLWQMARLWQPLREEGVAGTLLQPSLLRVNASTLQVLELVRDPADPRLQELAALWSPWVQTASPAICGFLAHLCEQLHSGTIADPETLVAVLDRALARCGRGQQRQYALAARTDSGPARDHNEDAVYASTKATEYGADALAIVCDGVGGHAGGEVAAQMAIAALLARATELPRAIAPQDPGAICRQLEAAVRATNDAISDRNDREKRQWRDRMGTTLVLALARAHELYLAHVGDSRVYWITRTSCQQLTLDDDVASREARLGQAFYRDALRQPTAGSLVQALGVAPSEALHPNVQRFVLDEDGVFLLCSDGLSDRDRVEQYWEQEILPVLEGRVTVEAAAERLLAIANTRNGHDNTTVAVLHCQVCPLAESEAALLGAWETWVPATAQALAAAAVAPQQLQLAQETVAPTKRAIRWRTGLGVLALSLLLGIGGLAIAYWAFPGVRATVDEFREPRFGSPAREPGDSEPGEDP